MPWVSLLMFLVSFLFSKSQGASTGQAAAIGAAAGLATYYVADPANPSNLLGFGTEAKTTPGSVATETTSVPPANGGGNTAAGVVKTGLQEAGGVLKSWGPTGTLAVVAGTTAIASDTKTWLPWALGAAAVFLLLK